MLFQGIAGIVLKSAFAVALLFLITKVIGKKHIAQLTFFDYIIGIALGSIAGSLSVDRSINLMDGFASLISLGVIAYAASVLSMKSIWGRRFFDSTPTIVIQNGKIIEKNLKKEKVNLNDLLEELRIKGVFNLADVEFAILETGGDVSVQFKSQKRPLTPSDINAKTDYEGLSANLIIDGKIMQENLVHSGVNEEWLLGELRTMNIASVDEVLLASLDTYGKLYISQKEEIRPRDVLE